MSTKIEALSLTGPKAVGEIKAVKAPYFNRVQLGSNTGPQLLLLESLRNNKFHSFQQWLESGSAPGGRRFASRVCPSGETVPEPSHSKNRSQSIHHPLRLLCMSKDRQNCHPLLGIVLNLRSSADSTRTRFRHSENLTTLAI
jgi:hypothetical protein